MRDQVDSRLPQPFGDRLHVVSRLLDRMEAANLVHRVRSSSDRRLVNTTLTERGLALVNALDEHVDALHSRQLGHLSEQELRTLIALLDKARHRE